MTYLSLDKVDELTFTFFSGDGRVQDLSRLYTREEIIAFLEENVRLMRAEVEGMTPEQLAYRLPGLPTGPDESGDEEHFNTSQIVSHTAAGTAFHHWNSTRALRHERPALVKPADGIEVTGKKRGGIGGGGWSGAPPEELLRLLDDAVGAFVGYIRGLTNEELLGGTSRWGPFSEMTPHDWLFVVAMHAGSHVNQIRQLKADAGYPR